MSNIYQGFKLTFPTGDPLGDDYETLANKAIGQKFTCPGSGPQDINKIGAWAEQGGAGTWRYWIANDGGVSPGTIVANSLTSEIDISDGAWFPFTYISKPSLTGGASYWLICWGGNQVVAATWATAGTSKLTDCIYSTTGDPNPETWNDILEDLWGIAAEYQAAGAYQPPGGGPADDRFRFRPSGRSCYTSTRIIHSPKWPMDAFWWAYDSQADNNSRMN